MRVACDAREAWSGRAMKAVQAVEAAQVRVLEILMAVLVAAFAVVALSSPDAAHAANGDAYTYTVRVLAGNQGYVDGGSIATIPGIKAGSRIYLAQQVEAEPKDDSMYYVKGFRVSGRDNDDGVYANNDSTYVTVNEDMDFVVAYGMKGDMVSYKVNFVEYQTGRVLANPVIHYGNMGDKPVVSYEYIQGYRPRYRNITGTLGPEGTNEWTFEYIKLAAGENEDGTTTGGTTGGTAGGTTGGTTGGTAGGTTGGTAGNASAGAASAGAASAGAASAGAASGNAASANAAPATPPATEEITDVDNPLAGGNNGDANNTTAPKTPTTSTETKSDKPSGMGIPVIAIFASAALLVAAVAAVIVVMRRRMN